MRRAEIPAGTHAPLEALGDVQRFAHARGSVWRPPSRGAAARVWSLAQAGIGGFVAAGVDDAGPWLLRGTVEATLHQARKSRSGPWPWSEVVTLACDMAEALAAAEAASLSTGPLTPRHVALIEGRGHIVAEDLVRVQLGVPGTTSGGQTRASELWWCPPEAEGFGAAPNRYALGVIVYELLAGEHPYGGAGLRHAMQLARRHEPPPFAPDIGSTLPPGLQSYLLGMLAPDPAARPVSARDIADAFAAARAGDRVVAKTETSAPAPTEHDEENAPPAQTKVLPDAAHGRRRAWVPWAVTLGISLAVIGLASVPEEAAPRPAAAVKKRVAALDAAHTTAEDCSSCHPRHAAEWGQSVMGHSVKSPLFNALEALIQEQVGRDLDCPNGAGVLRRADGGACRDRTTGLPVTGSGGEHWCINCHAPAENLKPTVPPWGGRFGSAASTRLPVKDAIGAVAREGITCAFCHQVEGPVGPAGSGGYEGNPDWVSFFTGRRFLSRPEDARGQLGIANSGYRLNPDMLLGDEVTVAGVAVHARPSDPARSYLKSSAFCGSCHDVRLFGTDVVGARRGEHFKRLRNAYSEYVRWAEDEQRAGRTPATCQGCHMSTYPGVCAPGEASDDGLIHESCPPDMHFEPRAPGALPEARVATASSAATPSAPHYFTGVDLPLAEELSDEALDRPGVDRLGVPLSMRKRRDLLLRHSLTLALGATRADAAELVIPITIENVGAGHKVPAGFSQEREIWVHLRVTDGSGRLVYEVGRVDRNDEDLHDKRFVRVNTNPRRLDAQGRPEGLFGANVVDGPDVPQWSPNPALGGERFRGRGLINFQNGFLRCVSCRGEIGADGSCLPLVGELHRAERFVDGQYDLDTGACISNLSGEHALFETYFPVGALDAERGVVKAPDAIIDTRSLTPNRPVTYVYELSRRGRTGPFEVEAELMFRSFPPFLVRAFADYEQQRAAEGARPSGPLVTHAMMRRLERVVLARASATVP